jgi:hypothetical protein
MLALCNALVSPFGNYGNTHSKPTSLSWRQVPGAPSTIEARTARKLRRQIVPFVFVLFVTSQRYGFLAGIFFFGYFTFEIPSNV